MKLHAFSANEHGETLKTWLSQIPFFKVLLDESMEIGFVYTPKHEPSKLTDGVESFASTTSDALSDDEFVELNIQTKLGHLHISLYFMEYGSYGDSDRQVEGVTFDPVSIEAILNGEAPILPLEDKFQQVLNDNKEIAELVQTYLTE